MSSVLLIGHLSVLHLCDLCEVETWMVAEEMHTHSKSKVRRFGRGRAL